MFPAPQDSSPTVTRSVGLTRLLSAIVVAVVLVISTQELPPNLPIKEDLARNNKLFLTVASRALKWEEPTAPVKIAGPRATAWPRTLRTRA